MVAECVGEQLVLQTNNKQCFLERMASAAETLLETDYARQIAIAN